MPKFFRKCHDCTKNRNIDDVKKIELLLNFLPYEICEKIISMTHKYSKCLNCHKTLCELHTYIEHEPIGNFGTIEVVCCLNCKREIEDIFF